MASPEVRTEALVLKKTKLGESDLILHLLATDGSAMRAVAKGARKPRNASSATLDLLNHVQLTIITGKSLGIAKGSKLVEHHPHLLADPALFAAASVVAEAADSVIQPDLPVARLFDMTRTVFASIAEAEEGALPLLVAAYAFKLTALLGMRPAFGACAVCDTPLGTLPHAARFSYEDGGAVCAECAAFADTTSISGPTLSLCDALLHSTFADIAHMPATEGAWEAASVAQMWLMRQTGTRMKSFAAFRTICGCMQASSVI